ncbi:MAG: hypothetical protein KatS3mg076_1100 [Candidatus Binatia bacterium]|nr:MAG: hypothetical protein KatS3mg076_1100 [Candidatus Binatia bacterium]
MRSLRSLGWLLAGVFLLGGVVPARALFLDDQQSVSFRAKVYSQAAIRLEDTDLPEGLSREENDTEPEVRQGQLVQHRNFFLPELDVKLNRYARNLRGTFLDFLAPDDLGFRLTAWGFYDGIYDYGTSQFGEQQSRINPNFRRYDAGICAGDPERNPDKGKPCSSGSDCSSGVCMPAGAWFLEGEKLRLPEGCTVVDENGLVRGRPRECFVDSLEELFPDHELKRPRDIYASQVRVNELYLNYSKGPFFLRIGKQAISWGEADTIALLDQNNPFDVTLAAPGIFQDLDEARIPLWTVRASYSLFDVLGPFSSGFVEAYWVPGFIDTNTGILPILTASPYSTRGRDPQFSSGFPNETHQFILFDHVPERKFSNSRYGFRFETLFRRSYTLQAWFYTHFPQAPVPRHVAPVNVKPGTNGARINQTICGPFFGQGCSPLFITEVVHDLTSVYGLAGTFFLEPLDGILRLEAEYFENEPGFIPQFNLNIRCTPPEPGQEKKGACSAEDARRDAIVRPAVDSVNDPGIVPKADILRYEIGFDRFFFVRPLNRANSFTMVVSHVGQYNFSETGHRDFKFGGVRKPGTDQLGRSPVPPDFVDLKPYEAFWQATILTNYLHGRLTPQITWVQDLRGTYVFHPTLEYRWSDSLILKADLVHIGGAYKGPGFFRDKDQIAFRVTYQLN